jgi:glycosyltransferase involved in cell wall biosynthesis
MPLVSIITPLYRAVRFVPQLVESLAAQTFRDFEWVCVDDCSPDETLAALEASLRGRLDVRLVRLPVNGGPAAARNAGLRVARGRFVAFLDADDLWLPDKLQRQVDFMRQGHRFTFHDYRPMSEDGFRAGGIVRGPDVVDWALLHKRRGIGCLTVMLDRAVIPVPLFPERSELGEETTHEDFVAWARILEQGVLAHRLPEDLARYRIAPTSRSANTLHGAWSTWHIYRVHHRIPLLRSAWYFANYVASAALLRVATRGGVGGGAGGRSPPR